ncbi:hypothetical protein GQ44DRAFT_697227 [Phaeosphaeriaceae sp. PMI808]|nr:hypothetical protein GQ44DRAFT_697227 [Phaeosphaeriaceae sp. PMI808]
MTLSASIEIAAPPNVVRQKFLTFDTLPQYHKGFFTTITPLGALEPGNKLAIEFTGMGKITSKILANEPTLFRWCGGNSLVFSGDHSFKFEPSTITPGGTTFTQEENFGGAFGFLMGEGFIAKQAGMGVKTTKGWEGFNQDLKKWCEGSTSE